MKNELKFNSQICTTKEQSQRLLDLGLKPETAECYNREEEYGFSNWIGKPSLPTDTPAWSLHRLMVIFLSHFDNSSLIFRNEQSPYDLLISDIEQMIEDGYFNKEYLKQ